MAIDPLTLSLILGGVQGIGGAMGQAGAEREGRAGRQLSLFEMIQQMLAGEDTRGDRNEQFAANYGLQAEDNRQRYGRDAVELQGRIDSAPLRDRAQYRLTNRLAAPPTNFRPRDITRGTGSFRAGPSGGVDLNADRAMMDRYTPGAGGITTNTDRQILERMLHPNIPGYAPPPRQSDEQIRRRAATTRNQIHGGRI